MLVCYNKVKISWTTGFKLLSFNLKYDLSILSILKQLKKTESILISHAIIMFNREVSSIFFIYVISVEQIFS